MENEKFTFKFEGGEEFKMTASEMKETGYNLLIAKHDWCSAWGEIKPFDESELRSGRVHFVTTKKPTIIPGRSNNT